MMKKLGLYFMRLTHRLAASRPRNKSYEPNIGIDRHRDGSAADREESMRTVRSRVQAFKL